MKFDDGDRVTDGTRTGTVFNYDGGFGAVGVNWDNGDEDYYIWNWYLTLVPESDKL